MRKGILSLLPVLFLIPIYGQVLLNGDFESHSAVSCKINMSNTDYSAAMKNSTGFGPGSNIDILNASCDFSHPQSGKWFIGLTGGGKGTDYDALSLELTDVLVKGKMYNLTYYEQANDSFSTEINPIKIGISYSATYFGDSIYSSVPEAGKWKKRSVDFVAPISGKYLTIAVVNKNFAWNFLDNMQISTSVGINEQPQNEFIGIYPTISNSGIFTLSYSGEQSTKVMIINLTGSVIKQLVISTGNNQLQLNGCAPGVYFVRVLTGNAVQTRRIVVSE